MIQLRGIQHNGEPRFYLVHDLKFRIQGHRVQITDHHCTGQFMTEPAVIDWIYSQPRMDWYVHHAAISQSAVIYDMEVIERDYQSFSGLQEAIAQEYLHSTLAFRARSIDPWFPQTTEEFEESWLVNLADVDRRHIDSGLSSEKDGFEL